MTNINNLDFDGKPGKVCLNQRKFFNFAKLHLKSYHDISKLSFRLKFSHCKIEKLCQQLRQFHSSLKIKDKLRGKICF